MAKLDWEFILGEVKKEINDEGLFVAWFKPIEVVSLKKDKLKLQVPDEFFMKWFKKNYLEYLEKIINTHYNSIKIEIISKNSTKIEKTETLIKKGVHKKVQESKLFGYLDPRFTFDTFVVGKSNEFAYAACNAVADEPGVRYNPLFIYGGVGLGKTHLLNASGNKLLKSGKHLRICCITAEQFINDFVKSSINNKLMDFQTFYRNSFDALLIDDIHYLEGKSGTQDQFFHIFNIFFNSKKQIILTSDKYPQNFSKMEERLKNRFEQGLIVDIKPPEYETKVAIIRKKALLENFELPESIAYYIVDRVQANNIRQLEGALVRVLAYSSITGKSIDEGLVDDALTGFVQKKRKITEEDILNTVSIHFNVKVSEIKSKRRKKHIIFPRQITMYLLREILGMSYMEIGSKFGGKDHTTVMHSVNKIKKLIKDEEHIQEVVDNIKRKLQ